MKFLLVSAVNAGGHRLNMYLLSSVLTLHFLHVVLPTELEKWRSPEFYEREVHRMQLPFSGKVPGGGVSVEERQERRAQQLRRLQEINARRREEKLQQDQERLDRLLAVQARSLLCHLQFIVIFFRFFNWCFICAVVHLAMRDTYNSNYKNVQHVL